MSMEHVDALVIGAGPSGTAAAAWLADKGHKVVIIERAIFPRFVIGESLLPLSMGHWEETGLLPALQAQNFAVKEGARFYRDGKLFKTTHKVGPGHGRYRALILMMYWRKP